MCSCAILASELVSSITHIELPSADREQTFRSILRDENRAALRQNGIVIYLRKDPARLSRDGRPLSKDADAVLQLYQTRKPIYESFADVTVDVTDDPRITTERVISCIS